MVFSATGYIVGYLPEQPQGSRYQSLVLMSDASFRLLDRADNEIAFAPSGDFVGMTPSPKRRMMRAMSHGQQRATFTYTLDATGNLRIASARLAEDPEAVSRPRWCAITTTTREGWCSHGFSAPGGST
jgi:hypothetical protein